jgi:hypothetical protein
MSLGSGTACGTWIFGWRGKSKPLASAPAGCAAAAHILRLAFGAREN